MKVDILGVGIYHGKILPVYSLTEAGGSRHLFTTLSSDQTRAIFRFYFKGEELSDWRPIGNIPIDRIVPAKAGEPTLELTLSELDEKDIVFRIGDMGSGRIKRFVISRDALRKISGGVPLTKQRKRSSRESSKTRRLLLGSGAAAGVLALALAYVFWLSPLFFPNEENPGPVEIEHSPAGVAVPAGQSDLQDAGGTIREEESGTMKAGEAGQDATPDDNENPTKEKTEEDSMQYRVKNGDTLWDLAEAYYGDAMLYLPLAQNNEIVIPQLILSGEDIRLPHEINNRKRIDSGSRY